MVEIYRDGGFRTGNGKAGMLTGRAFIAVSFHQLFLGGLLPSRARFRFAGSLPYTSLREAGRLLKRDSPASSSLLRRPNHYAMLP
jgi:hypothetical protein